MAKRNRRMLKSRVHPEQAIQTSNASAVDVRSKLEQQFTLMEQTHDRIRTQKLATRLRERVETDPLNHRNIFF